MATVQQPYFEDVKPGDMIPAREYGPLTIVSSVRWLGFQENPSRTHCDRDFVREHHGQKSFISSGAYRQSLLTRTITDWLGPRGKLRKMSVRQTYSTFEGDMMLFSGTVVEKSPTADDPWIRCELEGKNQDGRQILSGRCTVILPSRTSAAGK